MHVWNRNFLRRRGLPAVVAVLAAVSLAAPASAVRAPSCPDGGDWSQFHAGPAKTGWNCAEHVLSPTTVPDLVEHWRAGGNAFTGSPILHGDRVFFTTETVGGTLDTTDLVAVDRTSGSTVWSSRLATSSVPAPGAIAYADGRILVVDGDRLEAFRTDTGALDWFTDVGYSRGPTVRDHTAYLGSDGTVRAVSTTTGETLWNTSVPGSVSSEIAVSDKQVFVAAGSELFSLKRSNGSVGWHRTIGEVYGGGTAVLGNTVYVAANVPSEGSGAVLYAFGTGSGTLRWSAPAGDDVHSVPAVDDHNVYIGSIGSKVRAFDAGTGAPRWVVYLGGGEIWSSIASANGVVYLTTDTDHAYALSSTTGDILFDREPGSSGGFAAMGSPAVADGRVYFPFGSAGVVAYGLPGQ